MMEDHEVQERTRVMLMGASVVALCGLGSFFFLLVGIGAKPVPAPSKRFTKSMVIDSGHSEGNGDIATELVAGLFCKMPWPDRLR
jgi:hypothetical protein